MPPRRSRRPEPTTEVAPASSRPRRSPKTPFSAATGLHKRVTFEREHTRAARAMALLLERWDWSTSPELLNGVKELAKRYPALKGHEALALRAIREYEKLLWAFPALDDEEALLLLVEHGFSHRKALIARFRSQLPVDSFELYDDATIAAAFREAITRLKARGLDNAGLERATLRILRRA